MILVSTLIIVPLSFSNGCRKKSTKKATKISQKKRQKKIEDLYKEALVDVKEEKYAAATTKLNQALKVDPNNKKVQAKLKEVKVLAKKKGNSSSTGTTTQSGSSTASPTTGSTSATTDTPSTQTGTTSSNTGSSSTTNSGTTTDNSSSNQTNQTTGNTLKDIPSDATPLSILPEKLTGYSTASRGWIIEPSQAQGRYAPVDKTIKKEIDMVLITVAKFEKESVAKAHYNSEKELFPKDSKTVEVNGHDIYFGTYAESNPDLFPPSSTLTWTRNEWVFAVRVIPVNKLSADRLKDISVKLAEQVKY